MGKTVLITGGNRGIGLAIVEQLLKRAGVTTLCLACRNLPRAYGTKEMLLKKYPEAEIDIVVLDTANLHSVCRAALEIKSKFQHIDIIYCNAGTMSRTSVCWEGIFKHLLSRNCLSALLTGHGLLTQMDDWTEDGIKTMFATNLFGHFVLIKLVRNLLGCNGRCSQIIWTSSDNAMPQSFDINDIQHVNGNQPYSSSKYATDLLNIALNDKLNKKGIYSHTVCPGFVFTNMTYGILPYWIWYMFLPILLILRIFIPSFTLFPQTAAYGLASLSNQAPEGMNPRSKFATRVSVWNQPYVQENKIHCQVDLPAKVMEKLEELWEIHEHMFSELVN